MVCYACTRTTMKATSPTSHRCLLLSSLFAITGAFLTVVQRPTNMRIHHHHHHERQDRQRQTIAYSYQPEKDEEQQKQQQQEYRPISDYVGGLHGGKYVFDDRISGITALNYETSILVFDYPNNDDDDSSRQQKIAPPPEGDQPPRWASRKLGPEAFLDATLPTILDFDDQGKAIVKVVNEELSWEPFWACVETSKSDDDHTSPLLFTVSPDCGTLAPRGGSNDFSDCCRFEIQRRTMNQNHRQQNDQEEHDAFLVVRTEQDYWIWRLQ